MLVVVTDADVRAWNVPAQGADVREREPVRFRESGTDMDVVTEFGGPNVVALEVGYTHAVKLQHEAVLLQAFERRVLAQAQSSGAKHANLFVVGEQHRMPEIQHAEDGSNTSTVIGADADTRTCAAPDTLLFGNFRNHGVPAALGPHRVHVRYHDDRIRA